MWLHVVLEGCSKSSRNPINHTPVLPMQEQLRSWTITTCDGHREIVDLWEALSLLRVVIFQYLFTHQLLLASLTLAEFFLARDWRCARPIAGLWLADRICLKSLTSERVVTNAFPKLPKSYGLPLLQKAQSCIPLQHTWFQAWQHWKLDNAKNLYNKHRHTKKAPRAELFLVNVSWGRKEIVTRNPLLYEWSEAKRKPAQAKYIYVYVTYVTKYKCLSDIVRLCYVHISFVLRHCIGSMDQESLDACSAFTEPAISLSLSLWLALPWKGIGNQKEEQFRTMRIIWSGRNGVMVEGMKGIQYNSTSIWKTSRVEQERQPASQPSKEVFFRNAAIRNANVWTKYSIIESKRKPKDKRNAATSFALISTKLGLHAASVTFFLANGRNPAIWPLMCW